MKQIQINGRTFKKWIAFNPSSSETEEYWVSDKLYDFKWIIQQEGIDDKVPIQKGGNGRYTYAGLEIYELKKHPKLIEEIKGWDFEVEK